MSMMAADALKAGIATRTPINCAQYNTGGAIDDAMSILINYMVELDAAVAGAYLWIIIWGMIPALS